MRNRREINVFNISFLDLLSGALGAVIILYIAVPKAANKVEVVTKEMICPPCAECRADDMQIMISKRDEEIAKLNSQVATMKAKQEDERAIVKDCINADSKKSFVNGNAVDVGFSFAGKKIVFLVDVSGSMRDNDKIGQVKAGLKMLITSMGSMYHVDVVIYPNKLKGLYKPLWSDLRFVGQNNKQAIYEFFSKVRPFGATPTRSALKFVLENYYRATDIVLLSDGAPTVGNSRDLDNIDSILHEIRSLNKRKVRINTIGVGPEFLKESKNSKYQFLRKLASDHGGFFVGF